MTTVFKNPFLITEINDEIEQRWEKDMPRTSCRVINVHAKLTAFQGGRGFVTVPTGKENPDDDVYVVSVFHQLHCLVSLRVTFKIPLEANCLMANPTLPVYDPAVVHQGHGKFVSSATARGVSHLSLR